MKTIYVKCCLDKVYRSKEKMVLDWKVIYSVMDLTYSPEDATVGRELLSSSELLDIMERIGTLDFEVKYIECENEDEYDDDNFIG